MQDILGYQDKMKRTFTPEEKLFFMDKVGDLWRYEAIIDFGCADGTMLRYIDAELYNFYHMGLSTYLRPILYGIDSSEEMRKSFRNRPMNFTNNIGLSRSIKSVQIRSKYSPVLLILSSVLHEVDEQTYQDLVQFCEEHNVTIVMRDMCFDCFNHESDEIIDHIVDTLSATEREKLELIETRIIEKEEDLLHLIGDLRTLVLYEYFMKYTYIENWETESREWYFCNRIWEFRNRLLGRKADRYKLQYEKRYVLPYKREQVLQDFGYELRFPTHYKAILSKGEII